MEISLDEGEQERVVELCHKLTPILSEYTWGVVYHALISLSCYTGVQVGASLMDTLSLVTDSHAAMSAILDDETTEVDNGYRTIQ